MDEDTDHRFKRQKRTALFNDDEKRELCGMVKELPELWDLENHNHGNKSVTDKAWRNISSILDKPVNDCRTAWIALRESYRYQLRVANKAKNSRAWSSQNGPQFDESDYDDFGEFSVLSALSFLPNIYLRLCKKCPPGPKMTHEETISSNERSISRNRRTSTPPTIVKEESLSSNEPETLYDCNTFCGMPPSPTPQSISVAAEEDHTNMQPLPVGKVRQNELSSQAPIDMSPFRAPLMNIEWLLAKLPREVAEDCCCDFQTLLLAKIREFKPTRTQNVNKK